MEETYGYYWGIDDTTLYTILAIAGAIVLLGIVINWRIFQKAGQPGWTSLIPFYNLYIFLKIVGKPGWWLLLMLIPVVNFVFGIWTINLLSKSFGKDVGFTLGLIFLPFIFYPVLAFGGARYQGPYGNPAAFEEYQGKNRFDFEKVNY